jgi:hypothetical protein
VLATADRAAAAAAYQRSSDLTGHSHTRRAKSVLVKDSVILASHLRLQSTWTEIILKVNPLKAQFLLNNT